MAEFPALPLWTDAFLSDTMHLDATETGAYLLLLMTAWRRPNNDLPDDDVQLRRFARVSAKEWRTIKSRVMAFWHIGDNGAWQQKKLNKERDRLRTNSKKRQSAARTRWDKSLKDNRAATADAEAMHAVGNSNHIHNHIHIDSDAAASDAGASGDPRTRLFNEGLATLAKMTGKGPNACRSFVGKCLKAADDDAVVVLGLIEEAQHNRVADPSAWIAAHLKTRTKPNGKNQGGGLLAALDRALEQSQDADLAATAHPVLLIPKRPV